MRELFSGMPAPLPGDAEKTVFVDPTIGDHEVRRRWEARAAQWRARELAEVVFGGEVRARLSGQTNGDPFRALLHLDVPFLDLDRHRALEAVFLACAAVDPVLEQVSLIYVLGPAAG